MPTALKTDAKTRILTSALFLFNRFGVVNVRLQHIADETGLSVGNLAYHYKTKDDIINTLYQDIIAQQRLLLASLRMIPIFENLNQFFQDTFALQQHYSFFYTDTLEVMRAYPTIRQTHREHLQWQTKQLENWLGFNVARGAIHQPSWPDTTERLAYRLLMQLETKLTFAGLSGQRADTLAPDEYVLDLWALLASQFTLTGQNEYRYLSVNPFESGY